MIPVPILAETMSDEMFFKLDGKKISFEKGDTIMDAVLRAGEYIPHLCHSPEFAPHGSCRVCVVNINNKSVSACTQPADENMEVDNSSESIMQKRRAVLQMLFVEGNHVCPGCEKSGACQLQAVAYYCKMLSPHFTHFYPQRSVDATHAEVLIDFNRCILCELCVRASRDIDKKNVFATGGRGIKSHLLINSESGKLRDSEFTSSDKSASICPVGAILPKHNAYNEPIGQRMYDKQSINNVGDVSGKGRSDG